MMYACSKGHLDVALALLKAGVQRCGLEHRDHGVSPLPAYTALCLFSLWAAFALQHNMPSGRKVLHTC